MPRPPRAFLPEEDQGAFFIELRLPEGSTVARTTRAAEQVESIVRDLAGVEDVTTVIGFSLLNGLAQSNSAFMIVGSSRSRSAPIPRPRSMR